MASGLFNTGKLLAVAPLIAATTTLHYAWDEHYFLSIFLSKPLQDPARKPPRVYDAIELTEPPAETPLANMRQTTNSLIPAYFSTFFKNGFGFLLGANAITIGTAIANLRSAPIRHAADPTKWYLYAAGLAFTVAHFLCVPLVMTPVEGLISRTEGKPRDEPHSLLQSWLNGHYIRTFLTDIPAWLCLVGAVIV